MFCLSMPSKKWVHVPDYTTNFFVFTAQARDKLPYLRTHLFIANALKLNIFECLWFKEIN